MKRIIVPFIILAVLIGAGGYILQNPPGAQHHQPPTGPQTVVEVVPVAVRDYQITVNSYGTVQPRTQSILVAQVSGQIVKVKDDFRPGGFFSAGDTLVTIDPRDYQADVQIAQATLMDALQVEAEEGARAEQAKRDWQRVSKPGENPSELALRVPQIEAAKARVASARSSLTKAQLDLQRTSVRALFDGRVLRQLADIGQVVTLGVQLAEVYATDFAEIRLPVRNSDLAFVDLPEARSEFSPTVVINSDLGGVTRWQGHIIRTEGAIDEVARQLHIVAQIDDPFGTRNRVERPLKIGEYVTAEITGRKLSNVIVVPVNTIYQNSYVYVVQHGLLQRRDIVIAWQNSIEAVIAKGLTDSDLLVTTPLGQITSGTPVRIAGERIANENDRSAVEPGPATSGVAN